MSNSTATACGLSVVGGMLLMASLLATPVNAVEGGAPPLQPSQRPPWNPTEVPAPPSSLAGVPCESVCGHVINLASNRGEPEITVSFTNLDAQTDAAGHYGYGRLGLDVGFLNVVPDDASGLRPVTRDIALAPRLGLPVVVNLGVCRDGEAVSPLIVPAVSVSPEHARRGDQVVFVAKVHNSLDTPLSGVWLTDLLPVGLTLSGVSSDRGDIVRSGNYAAVSTWLGPGETMTVSIYADVAADAPLGPLYNTISLIYSEHAAAQTATRLDVGSPGPTTLPATGYALSNFGIAIVLSLALLIVRRIRLRRLR